jgi:hypothetical protein
MTEKGYGAGRRRFLLGSCLGPVAFALAAACGGPPVRPPNPTQPLDERRAVQIIVATLKAQHDSAIMGRTVLLVSGKPLSVDVTAAGHKWGIAYVTSSERHSLGVALPMPELGMEEALQVVRGTGNDFDSKILVLHDTNYLYDDEVGEEHRATIVTAEAKLERDVRDFAIRAHAAEWP